MATQFTTPTEAFTSEEFIPNNEEVFLDLEHSSIHNHVLRTVTTPGNEGWFADETIDVAFELVERNPLCKKQRIALLGTHFAKRCYNANRDGDVTRTSYMEEKKIFKNRSFIIIPINDAYTRQAHTDQAVGAHWTLLLVDLRIRLQARYIDSLMDREPGSKPLNFDVAQRVYHGLQLILQSTGYERPIVPFLLDHVERNSPCQFYNNLCEADAGAACGPFIIRMAKQYATVIVKKNLGNELGPIPWITDEEFHTIKFDSSQIRHEVLQDIVHEKQLRTSRVGKATNYQLYNDWEITAEQQRKEAERAIPATDPQLYNDAEIAAGEQYVEAYNASSTTNDQLYNDQAIAAKEQYEADAEAAKMANEMSLVFPYIQHL
ncbi:hypothetical protein BDV96DRAFT_647197 [Lophiotrema nucula]|uniref:Ubiquitin-like protease family profile domain-containing protein n=1 Tax=Lophiotrema nucula TaxID=690887 RepID=A0A6A5Z4Y5_9PLEO|nr:hypothetical protein BDV96DRAFT_647197 [Lophiotrema nucula]